MQSSLGNSNPFTQLKWEYETKQREREGNRSQQTTKKKQALDDIEQIIKPILEGYKEIRVIDRKPYEVKKFEKPDRWSLGYLKDGSDWTQIINISPNFDNQGEIEYLSVSMGKSMNSPEPWLICDPSEKALVSAITELHRKQHGY